jgi:hypothetical protein
MSAHAALEHSEHIAHAGLGGDRLGTYIGVTMAILGVLLAFSSAMVGSERTHQWGLGDCFASLAMTRTLRPRQEHHAPR